MLQQFAITPDVFHPKIIAQYPKLEVAIGFILEALSKHGMLANLHRGEWYRFIQRQLLPCLNPETRRDILDYFDIIDRRGRLILHPAYNNQEALGADDWFYAAEECYDSAGLDGIIVSPLLFAKHTSPLIPVIDATKAYKSPAWKTQATSLKVKTEAYDYQAQLKPLLRYARWVHLIEPYFKCEDDDCFEILNISCQFLGERQGQTRRAHIHIHTGDPTPRECDKSERPYYEQNCMEAWKFRLHDLVNKYKPHQYDFTVSFWRNFHWQERLHDRYILTNQCGIAIQYGLRLKKGNETVWNLLDHKTHMSIQDDFQASGKYDLLKRFSVPEPVD